MAKTLDEAGVKRLIQEIKGANKNLNTPIPISTENTTESMAQNVKNIADYVEKAKAAGITNVNGMAVTCTIDGDYSGVGYLYSENTFCGIEIYGDETAYYIVVDNTGYCNEDGIILKGDENVVTSQMLSQGARKPIILTPDTTEVDEETYQKLLSDDVDVIANFGEGIFIESQAKFNTGDTLNLIFGYSEFDESNDGAIATYTISINTSAPHTLTLAAIGLCEPVSKATLSPVLQEIDLTGTDADRKAKLDKFETHWKDLTGANDLSGARFVGKFVITEDIDRNVTGIMTYCVGDDVNETNDNCFYGICNGYSFSEQKSQIAVKVSCTDGSITITPLFSHLEAITIYTDNTPDDKAANVAAIKAYVDNLELLGVDTTKGYSIPIYVEGQGTGFISKRGDSITSYMGIAVSFGIPVFGIFVDSAGGYYAYKLQTETDNSLTTTSKQVVGAINEVNALAKSKQDALTSGTNIKTVNGQSLLGSGNIAISGGGDVTAAGNNTFTGTNTFYTVTNLNSGLIIRDATTDDRYKIHGDAYCLIMQNIDDVNIDIKIRGVLTPEQDNDAANKKYVDDKVAAAGGSAPVLVNIDDISGSIGSSVSVDVFNTIANAASAKTPIFGYSELVEGSKATYEIIPLYVKNISTTSTSTASALSIQFVRASAYNSVLITKRSDTECNILLSVSSTFALDTSVDKSSTKGVQSSAVWNEIHSEPMTVNTATSGVTTLSSEDKHKILCYAASGTQQYNLPESPVDGETFLFLKVKSGHAITIQSGTGNQDIYDCSSENSSVSKKIASSTRSKITVTYSSTVGKWFLMADDFIS